MSCRSAIACLLAALAASACTRPDDAANQANAAASGEVTSGEVSAAGAPPAPSSVTKFDRSHAGETPPAVAFSDAAGQSVTLATFKGHPVLVNLWATWCAPCVKELPTLDALAKQGKLSVAANRQDSDPAKAAAFLKERKLADLTPYRDEKMALSLAYQATLPMTVLLGSDGKEIWRKLGDTDWTGPEAAKMLAEAK